MNAERLNDLTRTAALIVVKFLMTRHADETGRAVGKKIPDENINTNVPM